MLVLRASHYSAGDTFGRVAFPTSEDVINVTDYDIRNQISIPGEYLEARVEADDGIV